VRTADGRHFDYELVIGADGARSTVRRWVAPEHPDAVYAGFLLWRAMVAETPGSRTLPTALRVAATDAPLLATPEYNHTIPGVMGNVIDWLSRRLPTSPLRDKPIALMGAGGGGGSVRAQAA
jgi:2-polyprenyl-6-methoxyphenol hydroxylase-like FAD-dependent oxidoreductase